MADKELYKGQLENLKAISSIQDSIKRNEEIIARTSGIVAKNQRIKKQQAQAALKAVQKENQILTSVAKNTIKVKDGLKDGLDEIVGMTENIPIVGNRLSKVLSPAADKASEIFKCYRFQLDLHENFNLQYRREKYVPIF